MFEAGNIRQARERIIGEFLTLVLTCSPLGEFVRMTQLRRRRRSVHPGDKFLRASVAAPGEAHTRQRFARHARERLLPDGA